MTKLSINIEEMKIKTSKQGHLVVNFADKAGLEKAKNDLEEVKNEIKVTFLALLAVALARPDKLPSSGYLAPQKPILYAPPPPNYGTPAPPVYQTPKPTSEIPYVKGMPFDFQYAVKDEYNGLDFEHRSKSDGNVVNGQYQVLLPDGRIQTVTYNADHSKGYLADVVYKGEAQYPKTQSYKPAPTYSSPAPTYKAPTPSYKAPTPPRSSPAPTKATTPYRSSPAPSKATTPSRSSPAPPSKAITPPRSSPAPSKAPTPSYSSPVPPYSPRAPSNKTPAPSFSSPAPSYKTPAPSYKAPTSLYFPPPPPFPVRS
ncbi:cuticle protein-like [Palaemon carinicauda]|uniref:cuticle protein-like n=1 Tax=Palaemon carinicauda TaxID=392227 RepID=UPI0035B5D3FC